MIVALSPDHLGPQLRDSIACQSMCTLEGSLLPWGVRPSDIGLCCATDHRVPSKSLETWTLRERVLAQVP